MSTLNPTATNPTTTTVPSQVTKDGMNWMVTALDPFHDFQLELEGFPDLHSEPSVCQLWSSSVTISCPAGVTTNTWDSNIMFTGYDCDASHNVKLLPEPNFPYVTYTSTSIPGTFGFAPITIISGNNGQSLQLNATAATSERQYLYTRNNSSDPGRLIAVAFEVHNTTSSLNKQGTVCTAMIPSFQTTAENAFYKDTLAAYADYYVPADKRGDFPATQDQVRQITTACTWEAAEGVYVIPRLVNEDLPVGRSFVSRTPAIKSAGTGFVSEPAGLLVGSTPSIYGPCPSSFAPVCSYFTGLSKETTLTVTCRAIVEYFPNIASSLLPIATPSAPYDPAVLQAYNETVTKAPYAVPVRMNAGGRYFREALGVLGRVAPYVASALKGFAPVASMAVGFLGSGASALAARPRDMIVQPVRTSAPPARRRASKPTRVRGVGVKVSKRR